MCIKEVTGEVIPKDISILEQHFLNTKIKSFVQVLCDYSDKLHFLICYKHNLL